MNTTKLKSFAPKVRVQLMEAVSRKLDYVLNAQTAELLAVADQVASLRTQAERNRDQLVERVAYTWFNRLAALRFLDARGWHPFHLKVLMPATDTEQQPELLKEMRRGALPEELRPHVDETLLNDLLDGRVQPSVQGADPQGEVYRHLVLGVCRYYHALMPFLFGAIDDESGLLIPDDLLTTTSVAQGFRDAITDTDCEQVEVLGWLYQFYISEKKDEVFADLKKNKKITPENIPAATQLFTPHWIVRYLVENSLGRLWMLNRPQSRLVDQMAYYIPSEEPVSDYLRVSSPEELRLCDPACGSGHMLTYAFDLLYAIYEEEGYAPADIPVNILSHNLYGIEIDQRAGTLAAFALTMKAREKHRRFFHRMSTREERIEPQICVLKNVKIEPRDLQAYAGHIGDELFTTDLRETLGQFEQATNFGSLIVPRMANPAKSANELRAKGFGEDLTLRGTHNQVLEVLEMADFLSSKYHVVVANPPYMGGKGMNGKLQSFAKDQYPDSKSDLFAMFMERNLNLVRNQGSVGMITMQSWMFLSSFEKLRTKILDEGTILSMAHIGARGFDSIGGEVVSTTAFVLSNEHMSNHKGAFVRLVDGKTEAEKSKMFLEAIQ